MRVVLSSLLVATAFFGNATCTYYDIGWLSDEQASQALRRLLVRIKGDFLGDDLARQAKKSP